RTAHTAHTARSAPTDPFPGDLMIKRPRTLRVTVALAAAALALAACSGGGSGGSGDPGDSTGEPTGAESAGPTVIEHAFGETEVPADAHSVVTLGWGSADAALALGVVPTAMEEQA